MKRIHKKLLYLCLALLGIMSIVGCTKGQSKDAVALAVIYMDGFEAFTKVGDEYTEQGLQLQADYAYRWAYASVASMRYCVDSLLYLKGEGNSLDEVVGDQIGDWDTIASINYASPYPWFFEGVVYHAQGKEDAALICYEKALSNPAFEVETNKALMSFEAMDVATLKEIKKRLLTMEEALSKKVTLEEQTLPRETYSFDDSYLRNQAKKALEKETPDYEMALRLYEGALSVNPFDGDNFLGCALMCLELDDSDKMYFYVNEGLYVDPEHKGLQVLADALNQEVVD